MRVLVCSDRIGRLGPAEASAVVASAFQACGAQVAVAPLAEGGPELAQAVERFDPDARVVMVSSLSQLLDEWGQHPTYFDATRLAAPSLPELVALPHIAAVETTLIVPHSGAKLLLTGLHGAVAEQGRRAGQDLADTLAADTDAEAWLARLGIADGPGAGALGGLGAWALGQGARVASGLDVSAAGYQLSKLAAKADVVVTGTDVLDFHHRGGEVVRRLTDIATEALTPVIVVAGRNFVSARELRLSGIEEAHAVAPAGAGDVMVGEEQLRDLAARVAATWTW
ncbi:MAG: glycerate kinase [Propionibacteriaceae bacterium]|nr:glycerate kinase [Propionibacteriaceae bacterium]